MVFTIRQEELQNVVVSVLRQTGLSVLQLRLLTNSTQTVERDNISMLKFKDLLNAFYRTRIHSYDKE